ncbi:MAG: ribosome maturation factor RimP [Actinobacteria bacterium]|jgi:ribosome maturation factor RimP|nr:ribosome maturation factor RimP [Actinomycetota bacterium]
MSLQDSLTELLRPAVENAGFFLEQVLISNPGNHQILTCVIDGPKPLNLDEVTVVSRLISELLDETELISGAFTLEVTSPGVDRPLTQRRHWEKNVSRLITMVMHDGSLLTARLTELRDVDAVFIENIKGRMKTHTIVLANIKKAHVEVEFSRKDDN